MSGQLLLGVDIGSTRMKAGLFDTEGRQVGLEYAEYPILHEEPLAAEHDPKNWLASFRTLVRTLLRTRGVAASHIAGISVDCLCPSVIPVSRRGVPLMNSIFFMDRRSIGEAKWMEKEIGSAAFFSVTGNRIAHSAFSAPIMLWIKRKHPKVFEATFKFLHGNGLIEHYLTGQFAMDWTNASFTLLFETRNRRRWSQRLCEELGLPIDKLPDLKAPWEVVGEVTKEASGETGLAKGTPVIAGGADTACAALGVGAVDSGDAMEDGGTATKLAVATDRPNFPIETLNRCHVIPDRWLLVAASSTTGALLRWLKDLLGTYESEAKGKRIDVYKLMDRDAAKSPPGANGVIVLPYFAPGGERSPIWDPYARGVIFGLTLARGRRDIVRAVLEASAYALRDNITMIEGHGVKIGTIRLSGGQASSELWRRIKADATGKSVAITTHVEATVFGTALLAGFGSGQYSDLRRVVRELVSVREVKRPNRSVAHIYKENFNAYKDTYERLRTGFEKFYS
jgi:xylulokinase